MKIIILILILFPLVSMGSLNIHEVNIYKSLHSMDIISDGKVIKSYHVMLGSDRKLQIGDKLVPEGNYYLDEKMNVQNSINLFILAILTMKTLNVHRLQRVILEVNFFCMDSLIKNLKYSNGF